MGVQGLTLFCFQKLANNTLKEAEKAESYLHTQSATNINKVSTDILCSFVKTQLNNRKQKR